MSVFDMPTEDVTREPSSSSPTPDEGSDPREAKPESQELDQLRRELSETRSLVSALMAQKAAGQPPQEEIKTFPVEELKAFAMREEGKLQFDASKTYTDQELRNFRKSIMEELKGQTQRQAAEEEFYAIVPELRDPNSVVSRTVDAQEQDIRRRRPSIDPGVARELAILKTIKSTGGTAPQQRFDPRARAAASAPGIGAPTGGAPDRGEEVTVTEADIETLRRMGSTFVDDPDPKKRQAALDALKRNKQSFRQRAMIQMGGMFGGQNG